MSRPDGKPTLRRGITATFPVRRIGTRCLRNPSPLPISRRTDRVRPEWPTPANSGTSPATRSRHPIRMEGMHPERPTPANSSTSRSHRSRHPIAGRDAPGMASIYNAQPFSQRPVRTVHRPEYTPGMIGTPIRPASEGIPQDMSGKSGFDLQNQEIMRTFGGVFGEMQEWLNWPAWKASKHQKCFRGSNPLLSAERSVLPI